MNSKRIRGKQMVSALLCWFLLSVSLAQADSSTVDVSAAPVVAVESQLSLQPAQVFARAETVLASLPAQDPERLRWAAIASEAAYQLALPDPATEYARSALRLNNVPANLRQRLLIALAFGLDLGGKPEEAMDTIVAVIATLEAGAFDPQYLVDALTARASVFSTLNDYRSALADLLRAYPLAPLDGQRTVRADVASSLGNVYSQLREYAHADKFYRETITYAQATQSILRLSIAEYSLAVNLRRMNRLDDAGDYFARSRQHSEQVGDAQGIAYADYGLGQVAFYKGNYDAAENYYAKALPVLVAANDLAPQGNIALGMARVHLSRKHYDAGIKQTELAIAIAKNASDREQQQMALRLRSEIYAANDNFRLAYRDLLTATEIESEINKARHDDNIAEQRVRFDSERQEQQNALLHQQNELNAAQLAGEKQTSRLYVVSVLALSVVLGFVLYIAHRNKAVRRKLAEQALTDELTGVANRRRIMQMLSGEFERARRYGTALTIAMLDLDHFKAINDGFGHDAGDEVLKYFATMVDGHLRKIDGLGRIGGEEFLVVLPHTTREDAHGVVERLRLSTLQLSCPKLRGERQPSVSIGLCTLTGADTAMELLIKRADEALYQAKEQGRNRVVAV